MSKRSDFTRRAADAYLTWDPRAVRALLPHLAPGTHFAEPCVGEGHLVAQLADAGHICTHMSDLSDGTDALSLGPLGLVITNPPWSRPILHRLIEHWLPGGCWALFDADWAHTTQRAMAKRFDVRTASDLMQHCTDIVSVGRLRWIEGSTMDGKDNCCWYRFALNGDGVTRFHGRIG